jgi:AraC-like DNA-binding protein
MGPECSTELQNDAASPVFDSGINNFNTLCKHCSLKNSQNAEKKACFDMHMEAVNEARLHGGAYIYVCPAGSVFWTSPFYVGERFAGALLSGGVKGSEKTREKVKALAQMMLVCTDQISRGGAQNFPIQLTDPDINSFRDEPESDEYNRPVIDDFSIGDDYTMEMERILLASLRRGDNIEAKKVLVELLNTHNKEARGNFQIFKLKAMELAVLLSRAASDSMNENNNVILDTNTNYLKKIEECSNLQEITDILCSITDQMSGGIFSFHGVCHFSVLRKAERYIWENYTRKISLQEIADASGLSASYFSTIFKEEMGENLSSYLNRLRVERAASMLITTNMPISGIAAACGFEDQSWFSKIFKNYTGFTPGKYREQGSILN